MDVDEALSEARALGRPSREVQIEVFDVLASAVERVRGFCDDLQVPAVHGTYQGGYQAARRDMLRALNGET